MMMVCLCVGGECVVSMLCVYGACGKCIGTAVLLFFFCHCCTTMHIHAHHTSPPIPPPIYHTPNTTEATLSFEDIRSRLNIPEEEVVRLLHSLSCAKYKLLTKTPEGRTINTSDTFCINHKFSDRARRIKVPLPPVDERKRVVEDVAKDRQYAVDAAIVRIMKSRKVGCVCGGGGCRWGGGLLAGVMWRAWGRG